MERPKEKDYTDFHEISGETMFSEIAYYEALEKYIDYLESNSKAPKTECVCYNNSAIYNHSITKCNKCHKEVKTIRGNPPVKDIP